jgi:hypothetical protein
MFPLISLQEAKRIRAIYFEEQNTETKVWHCFTVTFAVVRQDFSELATLTSCVL